LLFDRAQVVEWAATRGLATRAGFLTPQTSAFATGCQIEPLLRAGAIWRDVPAAEVLSVLEKVVAALPGATPPIRQLLTPDRGWNHLGGRGWRLRLAASQRAGCSWA
jgi:nitrogen PTS system EIIA component